MTLSSSTIFLQMFETVVTSLSPFSMTRRICLPSTPPLALSRLAARFEPSLAGTSIDCSEPVRLYGHPTTISPASCAKTGVVSLTLTMAASIGAATPSAAPRRRMSRRLTRWSIESLINRDTESVRSLFLTRCSSHRAFPAQTPAANLGRLPQTAMPQDHPVHLDSTAHYRDL